MTVDVRLAKESERQVWNDFAFSQPEGSFLQSWEWGDLQQQLQFKCWRFVAEESGAWQAVALVVKRDLPLGKSWLYLPHGPIGKLTESLQERLEQLAEEENAIFVRIDPSWTNAELLLKQGWKKADREVQPRDTVVLDLAQSEEQLLAAMHHKTRYNIRVASRKGVQVTFSRDIHEVEVFLGLARGVGERAGFHLHPDEYYRAFMKVLGEAGVAEVALAHHEGEALAVHLIVSMGDTATYVYGASSSHKRELMAPHLLQWETIKRAKQEGFKQYDFFGVAPEGASKEHSWAGITRFKEGFGGKREHYIGAYDLVLNEGMYHFFNVARRMRQILK